MEAQDFINALFPRTVAATQQGGGFPRRSLAGVLDAASMPGRAWSALANYDPNQPTLQDIINNPSRPANSGNFLSSMARTQAAGGDGLASNIAENIIRDPTSILGAGLGEAVGAGAAKLGGGVLGRLLSGGADVASQTGLQAANQYGTGGSVDPASMGLSAALMGAGHGIGAGVAQVAPKIAKAIPWANNQDAAMLERYGSEADAKAIKDRLQSWVDKGEQYGKLSNDELNSMPIDEMDALLPPIHSVEEKFWLSGKNGTQPPILARGWRYGSPENPNTSWNFQDQKAEPGVSAMQAFTEENPNVLGGSYQTFNAKNNKRTIEGWLDQSRTGSDGEPLFTGVRDLGPYPHPDPGFQYLIGGGTQLPTAQQGGFAKALAGKYLRQYANAQQGDQK